MSDWWRRFLSRHGPMKNNEKKLATSIMAEITTDMKIVLKLLCIGN